MRKSGVSWDKKTSKWRAQITHNRKLMHIGMFERPEDARQAVWDARQKILAQKEFKSLEDYLKNKGVLYQSIAKYFLDGGSGTVTEIATTIGAVRSNASVVVKRFYEDGLISISEWVLPLRSSRYCAVYTAGTIEDAPKPNQVESEFLPEPEPEHWIHMMQALAPRRSMEQVREINRLYAEYMGAR